MVVHWMGLDTAKPWRMRGQFNEIAQIRFSHVIQSTGVAGEEALNSKASFPSLIPIGLEKTHLKSSLESLKTPPITARPGFPKEEPSTFNFREPVQGFTRLPASLTHKGLDQFFFLIRTSH